MKILINIILYFSIIVSCPSWIFADSFAPPSGKTLLIIGQDRDTISRYAKATDRDLSGTMFYTSIKDLSGLGEPADYGSGPQDAGSLLKSYPHAVIQVGFYMVGALDDTISGQYDVNLRTLAQWIISAKRPVYLRVGYEFDNPQNHYDPDKYQAAFRYVVDFLRNQGVHNAAYVWHSYCADSNPRWMDWYPGNDYVDWFGVSIFSTGQLPAASDFLELGREHHKPFMICESAPNGMYSVRGKVDWYTHIFQFIENRNVEAFSYINSNWDVMPMYLNQHWGDSRIEQYPEVMDLWSTETEKDRYLKASGGLFRSLGLDSSD